VSSHCGDEESKECQRNIEVGWQVNCHVQVHPKVGREDSPDHTTA